MSHHPTRDAELRAALNTFGDAWSDSDQFRRGEIDYLAKLRPTAEDVPLLLEVAREWLRWGLPEDQQPVFAADDVAMYAPVHAWRCLGQMQAAEAIGPLVAMIEPLVAIEDDVFLENYPGVLACFGAEAIDAIDAVAANHRANEWGRVAVVAALELMAKRDPALRDEVVRRLCRYLEDLDTDATTFNGDVVSTLVELGAKEAAPLIERAYLAYAVDESVQGTLEWVLHDLGIGEKPNGPRYGSALSISGPQPVRRTDPRRDLRAKKKRERQAKKRSRR